MRRLIVAGALALALTGCGDPTDPRSESVDGVTQHFEVATPEGPLECVSWKHGYGGGLSCNWNGR